MRVRSRGGLHQPFSLAKKSAGVAFMALTLVGCSDGPPDFPNAELICGFDEAREQERLASAETFQNPLVLRMLVNGVEAWSIDNPSATPTLRPGDVVTLQGEGLGQGPDVDFTKIMIGNSRVLETDVVSYKQEMDVASQVHYETDELHGDGVWEKDILSWNDNEVRFTVPVHASQGPLRLQIQKRTGHLESMINPGEPHNVIDAQTKRVTEPSFMHDCDVVSELTDTTRAITPIQVKVENPQFQELVKEGRELFWSYDYNLGLAHKVRGLDWTKIFQGKTTDPIFQDKADPRKLFGAYPTTAGEVPAEAREDVYFSPYPQPTPIPGFLTLSPQLTEGNTRDSGYAGYRYAEGNHPYTGKGEWIGFNCASCHGYRIEYEKAPGQKVAKVFPGLPNPEWTMKWAVLGDKRGMTTATFEGIEAKEQGPSWAPGEADIDKTTLIYLMPGGTGEHNMVRMVGEGSATDNDYQFSPITIPNVTNHMPIRRSLSHTESYVGFEGSYVHAEEPDGATGSMLIQPLKALTAYMTVLDQDDNDLRNIGMYRWLKANGKLAQQTGNGNLSEGEFVQKGWQAFPGVVQAAKLGKNVYDRNCASCHSDAMGAHTNERMIPLHEVGRFFAPTIYQKETQSIRVSFLRDLYWVQSRGLLTDGHVRNLEDLVNPDRCTEGTALYNQYYTLHEPVRPEVGSPDQPKPWPDLNRKGDVFRVIKTENMWWTKTDEKRNRFIERHKYFVEVPWDKKHYYWDYQKMRAEYGPAELGSPGPIGMPAAPHPWCADSKANVSTLVQYVLTL